MSNKKGNRVPWSGHWEVTGAGMGVVTDHAGLVKSIQLPKPGEKFLKHNPPGESLDQITQDQKVRDAELVRSKGKSPVWRGSTKR